jgi:CelD/BcsL family acetyltransferase involved in cellulose biosynthesis
VSISVSLYNDAGAFLALADEWNDVLRNSAVDTVFLTVEYQETWWRHFGEGHPIILAVRRDDVLVGVAPLFAQGDYSVDRSLSFIGCVDVTDYADFIVARGEEEAVFAALLDYLAESIEEPWRTLDLCNIREDSPTLQWVPKLATDRGWSVEVTMQDVCPVVHLPSSWELYLQQLDGKLRRELNRKLRRAGAHAELSWYIVEEGRDLKVGVDAFLALMAASSAEKEAFLTPSMREFFQDLAETSFKAGWLKLAFLEVDGKKASSYFSFCYNKRVLVYNSGLNWKEFPRTGAGQVLTAHLIKHAIERGCEEYDFLRGDERYKYQFGAKDVELKRLMIKKA